MLGKRLAAPIRYRRTVRGAGSCALALLLVTGCEHAAHPAAARRQAIVSCPPAEVVPAYSDHRSYPRWDPTRPPPAARIVRCFASMSVASARGYPPGAPRGALLVDGVFLEPTGAAARRQCRAAARTLGYPVPCPGVVPETSSPAPSCSDGGGCVLGRRWFGFEEYGFFVPPWYRGVSGQPLGHFVLLASKVGRTENKEANCEPVIRVVTVEGAKAAIADCRSPGGMVSGHVTLRWVHQHVLVAVTVHGFTAANVALDLAVARHIEWVGARRSAACPHSNPCEFAG